MFYPITIILGWWFVLCLYGFCLFWLGCLSLWFTNGSCLWFCGSRGRLGKLTWHGLGPSWAGSVQMTKLLLWFPVTRVLTDTAVQYILAHAGLVCSKAAVLGVAT